MVESMRWALPLLAAGQAQKEVTHNEAILAIDRLLHLAVHSRGLSAPPMGAQTGELYIVGAHPVNDWAGCEDMLAGFDGAGWTTSMPLTGCLAWIIDESQFAVYNGRQWLTANWMLPGPRLGEIGEEVSSSQAVTVPKGGPNVDSECRVALTSLIAALGKQGIILPIT